jgi:hypothetical protein
LFGCDSTRHKNIVAVIIVDDPSSSLGGLPSGVSEGFALYRGDGSIAIPSNAQCRTSGNKTLKKFSA